MKAIYDKLRASLERRFSLCALVSDEDFQKQAVFFLPREPRRNVILESGSCDSRKR